MRHRRNVSIAAAIAVLGLALASCSGTPESPATETEEATGEGVLTIFAIPNGKAALDVLIPEFEEANPGIDVEITYAEVDSMVTTLRTQLASGTAADVFYAWPGNATAAGVSSLAPEGHLLDLSDQPYADMFPAGSRVTTTYDDKLYVLPLTVGSIGAIYNVAAVDEAGAALPETWDEVLEFCDDARDAGKVAFALGAQTLWNTQLINYALTPTLVYGPNPDFLDEQLAGDASFLDSKWKDSFEKMVEMQDRGCFQDSPLGTTYEVATEMVANGSALSIVSVMSTLSAVRAVAAPDTEFSMFALPATDDPDDTWLPSGAGSTYGINAKAKNPVAAKKFFEFLVSDSSLAQYGTLTGQLPIVVPEGFELDPALDVVVKYNAEGKTYPFPGELWPNAKVQAAHFDGVQRVLGGQASIDDALKEMDAAFND